jgi:hypothetical protein
VITPGFAKSLRISTLTSFGDFLSSFLASGKGSVEMRDLRKPGIDSNVEFNCVFDLWRKLVRSLYACGPPA